MSYFFKDFEDVAARVEVDDALSEFASAQNFGGQFFRDDNSLSGAHLFAPANECFPRIYSHLAREENFDLASAVLAPAIEARRENSRIVDYKAIAFMHIGRKVAKHAIFPGAGGAVDHQHTGGVAFGQRLLRD